jgi:hypothetical protein
MIVRRRGNQFVLINQHQHGLMSGVFAENLEQTIRPWEETLYAISHHDVGWEKLDKQILWDEETNQPYSFMDYPLEPKVNAYSDGIAAIDAHSIYAGYLCSKQCSYLLEKTDHQLAKNFLEKEQTRRQRMRKYLSLDEKQYLLDNFRLLRFCDDLSLSLCLNEPGEQTHPWYQNGIQYNGHQYEWLFEADHRIRLLPNLFRDSFVIQIPYQVVGRDRQVQEEGTYRWQVIV